MDKYKDLSHKEYIATLDQARTKFSELEKTFIESRIFSAESQHFDGMKISGNYLITNFKIINKNDIPHILDIELCNLNRVNNKCTMIDKIYPNVFWKKHQQLLNIQDEMILPFDCASNGNFMICNNENDIYVKFHSSLNVISFSCNYYKLTDDLQNAYINVYKKLRCTPNPIKIGVNNGFQCIGDFEKFTEFIIMRSYDFIKYGLNQVSVTFNNNHKYNIYINDDIETYNEFKIIDVHNDTYNKDISHIDLAFDVDPYYQKCHKISIYMFDMINYNYFCIDNVY